MFGTALNYARAVDLQRVAQAFLDLALVAEERGWGLFNAVEVPGWLAILVCLLAAVAGSFGRLAWFITLSSAPTVLRVADVDADGFVRRYEGLAERLA